MLYNAFGMKIELNKEDRKKLNALLETKEANLAIADMLMCFFEQDLRGYTIKSEDDYLKTFMDVMGFDSSLEDDVKIAKKYIGENLKKLDDSIFTKNPYYKAVKPALKKMGDYELKLDHFYPFQGFAYNDIIVDEKDSYVEKYPIGYFPHKVDMLALSYKKDIWMNISPNEINTMQPSIDEAYGNVLVFGLGLGYYAFMVSLKKDVKSVTIIEKDANIIKIFKDNLYKFFPNKDKIQIIQDDAYNYINNGKKYDYCFIDLWHNPEDGLPMYLKFKKLEKANTKYSYWLETGIKAMYRRCALIVIEEVLNGSTDENYKKAKNDIDKIINQIYFDNKDTVITSYQDIEKLINL